MNGEPEQQPETATAQVGVLATIPPEFQAPPADGVLDMRS